MDSPVCSKPQNYQPLEQGGLAAGNKVPLTNSGNDSECIDQLARTSVHNDPAGSYCSSLVSDAIALSEQAGLTRGNIACCGDQPANTGTALLSSGAILPYGCCLTTGLMGQTHFNDSLKEKP